MEKVSHNRILSVYEREEGENKSGIDHAVEEYYIYRQPLLHPSTQRNRSARPRRGCLSGIPLTLGMDKHRGL